MLGKIERGLHRRTYALFSYTGWRVRRHLNPIIAPQGHPALQISIAQSGGTLIPQLVYLRQVDVHSPFHHSWPLLNRSFPIALWLHNQWCVEIYASPFWQVGTVFEPINDQLHVT
jgi:hypothetical protein